MHFIPYSKYTIYSNLNEIEVIEILKKYTYTEVQAIPQSHDKLFEGKIYKEKFKVWTSGNEDDYFIIFKGILYKCIKGTKINVTARFPIFLIAAHISMLVLLTGAIVVALLSSNNIVAAGVASIILVNYYLLQIKYSRNLEAANRLLVTLFQLNGSRN